MNTLKSNRNLTKYACQKCHKLVGQVYGEWMDGEKGRDKVINYNCEKCTYGEEKKRKRKRNY